MLSLWVIGITFVNTLLLALICLSGDWLCGLQSVKGHPWSAALVDNGVHAVIGWASWALILLGSTTSVHRVLDLLSSTAYSRIHLWKFYEIGLCGLIASLVDLDHFVEARSWHIERAGFIVFVAMMSHHLRDAWRRGLWLPLIGDAIPIPYSFYILLVCVMPNFIRLYFMWRGFYFEKALSSFGHEDTNSTASLNIMNNSTYQDV
ncbi:hypothetical protein TCAL_12439 [Tigriopus californicus]|uniref:Transmembrane protein 267 n=1 Tax=Tigriopus californicus TaxID=6832 RepID=A0A553PIA6_TIGCA|nr:hypothetical protein TCAL_12439 [Tigriopus californicus]